MERTPLSTRFWAKVERKGPSECWPWVGGTNGRYGICGAGGKRGRLLKAHRLAWEFECGPIPEGGVLLHVCDNTRCVNPAHLRLGTQAENIADRNAKGRQAKGVRTACAKLNDEAVRDIRRTLRTGAATQRALARQYGVSDSIISTIWTRKAWVHVQD